MRRIISLLFISLMLLQAIPVLHLFSSQKEIFYVYIDEEKPEGAKEKKEGKEYLSVNVIRVFIHPSKTLYALAAAISYSPPALGFPTPPPEC